MKLSSHDDAALAALSPRDIAGWLRMRGFANSGQYGEYGAVFARIEDNETTELILPLSPKARDFARRMAELVADLSTALERPPTDILTELTLAPFDVIKVRSPDADDYGSIGLSTGIDLHQEARNIVLSAANTAASPLPRRSWRGRRFDEVSDYLQNVRLGQSQRGSFVLNLLSPWDFTPDSPPMFELGDETFGRRVTMSLATALNAAEAAMRRAPTEGIRPLVEAYKLGVSANLCSALAKLAREGDGVSVSVDWSPVRPNSMIANISLKREDASLLVEASKELSRQEPEPDFSLEGLVASIKEAPELFNGNAVIEMSLGGTIRRVHIHFGENERSLIYDAAKEKKWIRVVGDLEREGQRLKLLNPRDIAVIHVYEDESNALIFND
jgi:hypothetical protein